MPSGTLVTDSGLAAANPVAGASDMLRIVVVSIHLVQSFMRS